MECKVTSTSNKSINCKDTRDLSNPGSERECVDTLLCMLAGI